MLGIREIDQNWLAEAKDAYQEKNDKAFHDIDSAVKASFIVGILKSDQRKIRELNSLLVHFLVWQKSPSLPKWEVGLQTVHGWKAVADILEVLQKSESVAESVLEITKRIHFNEIVLMVLKHHTIRQADLARELSMEENNLLPKVKSLMELGILEKRKIQGAVYLKVTPRGMTIAEELQMQKIKVTGNEQIPIRLEDSFIEAIISSLSEIPGEYRTRFAYKFAENVHQVISKNSLKKLKRKIEEIMDIPKQMDEKFVYLQIKKILTTTQLIVDEREKLKKCQLAAKEFYALFPPNDGDEKIFNAKIKNTGVARIGDPLIRVPASEPAFYLKSCLEYNKDNKEYLFNNYSYTKNLIKYKKMVSRRKTY